jgi:hypothetical protein
MYEHLSDREFMELLMSTIADLAAATAVLTTEVAAVQAALANGETVLSASDQTSLDSSVSAVNAANATLATIAPAPAAVAQPPSGQ